MQQFGHGEGAFFGLLLQPFCMIDNSSSDVRKDNTSKEVQIFCVSGLQASSGKTTGIVESWV